MMLRKDDPQFKALVDKTIDAVMKSGEINKIYAKWFTSPIPPKGINLNFPQTPAIKDAFAHPNDKGVLGSRGCLTQPESAKGRKANLPLPALCVCTAARSAGAAWDGGERCMSSTGTSSSRNCPAAARNTGSSSPPASAGRLRCPPVPGSSH